MGEGLIRYQRTGVWDTLVNQEHVQSVRSARTPCRIAHLEGDRSMRHQTSVQWSTER